MNDKQRLMIKAAKLYYDKGLTQEAISQKLRLSRPRVSRLLQEALDSGIVRVTISPVVGSFAEVEAQLEERFGLCEAVVVEVSDPDSRPAIARELGPVAADVFTRLVQDGDVIGLSWGTCLASMVEHLQPQKKNGAVVVQMTGGLGAPDTDSHATDIASRTAMALGATLRLLPAPGIVRSVDTARLLRSERYIAQALETAQKTNIAFLGVGSTSPNSPPIHDGIITLDEAAELSRMGAVGELNLRFYNIDGELVKSDLDERVIGVQLDTIRSIDHVVAVAGGREKFHAILGALRGGLIHTLITDTATAVRLLEEES
jgi:DNA-binding transcriptional regulator LsrR (DeoR family)